MIRWPARAISALVKLFEPLQEVDVYVEDANDEVFYSHLLGRLSSDGLSVRRVFALGGRTAVIDAARSHVPGQRKAVYLIDGDLEWVRGDGPPLGVPWLHRLEFYCIENAVLCSVAIARLVVEELTVTQTDAVKLLAFDSWRRTIERPLVDLFVAYAICSVLAPTRSTVARGVGNLCKQIARTTLLDPEKVQREIQDAIDEAARSSGLTHVLNRDASVRSRVAALECPLDIVSGKDYLLPLLDFKLQSLGCRIRRDSLRTRLALHCDLGKLTGLRNVLLNA